jgi:ATP-binding cassette subfamily F protein 3
VLVSHDMHLLGLVADRLWLVKDGDVGPYEGDLDDYRKFLLSGDSPEKPAVEVAKPAPKRPSRDAVLGLRSEVRKAEERVQKLTEMMGKLDVKLADPNLYNDPYEAKKWGSKRTEAVKALAFAEELWMTALEKLDRAEKS